MTSFLSVLPRDLVDEVLSFLLEDPNDYAVLRQVAKVLEIPLPSQPRILIIKRFVSRIARIEWAVANGLSLYNNWIIIAAASEGSLDVVKWAREKGQQWHVGVCHYAAVNGKFETLRWVREQGCPWYPGCVIECAIESQHLEMVKWLVLETNDYSWRQPHACRTAAVTGKLEILQWLRSQGCPWNPEDIVKSLGERYPEVVKWIKANSI